MLPEWMGQDFLGDSNIRDLVGACAWIVPGPRWKLFALSRNTLVSFFIGVVESRELSISGVRRLTKQWWSWIPANLVVTFAAFARGSVGARGAA